MLQQYRHYQYKFAIVGHSNDEEVPGNLDHIVMNNNVSFHYFAECGATTGQNDYGFELIHEITGTMDTAGKYNRKYKHANPRDRRKKDCQSRYLWRETTPNQTISIKNYGSRDQDRSRLYEDSLNGLFSCLSRIEVAPGHYEYPRYQPPHIKMPNRSIDHNTTCDVQNVCHDFLEMMDIVKNSRMPTSITANLHTLINCIVESVNSPAQVNWRQQNGITNFDISIFGIFCRGSGRDLFGAGGRSMDDPENLTAVEHYVTDHFGRRHPIYTTQFIANVEELAQTEFDPTYESTDSKVSFAKLDPGANLKIKPETTVLAMETDYYDEDGEPVVNEIKTFKDYETDKPSWPPGTPIIVQSLEEWMAAPVPKDGGSGRYGGAKKKKKQKEKTKKTKRSRKSRTSAAVPRTSAAVPRTSGAVSRTSTAVSKTSAAVSKTSAAVSKTRRRHTNNK